MDSITNALTLFRAPADRFATSMAEVIEHVTMTDRGLRGLASHVLRPFEPGERSALDDAALADLRYARL
jgi:hypothetical protein